MVLPACVCARTHLGDLGLAVATDERRGGPDLSLGNELVADGVGEGGRVPRGIKGLRREGGQRGVDRWCEKGGWTTTEWPCLRSRHAVLEQPAKCGAAFLPQSWWMRAWKLPSLSTAPQSEAISEQPVVQEKRVVVILKIFS